jgi:hypothetical protein
LKDARTDKNKYKTDYLGLSKVGTGYLFALQDTAEYNAGEAETRKWNLIRIYQKLSKKLISYKKTEQELINMESDSIMDNIVDMLCDLCGYDD